MNNMPAANMTDAETVAWLLSRRTSLRMLLTANEKLLESQYGVTVLDTVDGFHWWRNGAADKRDLSEMAYVADQQHKVVPLLMQPFQPKERG
jgi:hypothetical protein